MAGASFKITLRDTGIEKALNRLGDRALEPLILKNLGELNLKQTRRRFGAQSDPEGRSWVPLNPLYATTKKGPRILEGAGGMRGGLLGSIIYQVGGREVAIGTNKIYGAIHQFGGVIRPRSADALVFRMGGELIHARSVRIPARPYLGAGPADRAQMVSLVEGILRRDWA